MKKYSIGRIISLIGILILAIGLICNSFELISLTIFRIVVLAGIITQIVALVLILTKKEF